MSTPQELNSLVPRLRTRLYEVRMAYAVVWVLCMVCGMTADDAWIDPSLLRAVHGPCINARQATRVISVVYLWLYARV